MSEKDCGHHDEELKNLYRRLFVALIILLLFIILLIWLILRPKNPRFTLQDATLYAFNVTATTANLLTLTLTLTLNLNLQISLSSHNPNNRIGIYYDKLHIYASYRSQQITLPTLLPATYQGHKEVTVWSPFLYGNAVPVAPYVADSLAQDETAGTVLINVKVFGKVRWKVGTFISGRYSLHVNCPAYITFGKENNGLAVGPAVRFQLVQSCNVDV